MNDIGYSVQTFDGDTFYVEDLDTANELIFHLLYKCDIVLENYLADLQKAIKLGGNSAATHPQSYESYIIDILRDESRLEAYDIGITEIKFTTLEQINKYFPIK